jgi:hypothetical protein
VRDGAPCRHDTQQFVELRILTRVDRLERQRFADRLLAGFALACKFAFEPLAFGVKRGNTALDEFQLRCGVCMLFFQRLTLMGGLLQQLFRQRFVTVLHVRQCARARVRSTAARSAVAASSCAWRSWAVASSAALRSRSIAF